MIYLLFALYLFFIQKSMIYYPDNQNFVTCTAFNDYEKLEHNGTRFYYKENSLEDVFVYYHGNAGSACDRAYHKSIFEESGRSVIFVEYIGYSADDKEPSQKLILKDVENIHEFIEAKYFEDIIVYGQSIGSGAASYHALLGNVNSLILVSTFSSLDDIVQSKYIVYPASILLREKYNNSEWLENFKGDLLILHGDSDVDIPARFSQKLFDGIENENKEYILIEGAGHNDMWSFNEFKTRIINFLSF